MDQGNFPPPSNEYSEVDDQNASTLMSTKHPNTAENSKSFDPRHSFNFNKLSPEDRNILKSISRDATVYRGYPCAAVSAGLTYYGIGKWFPKFSQPGKAALALVAGIVGNVVGRVTYIPTALKNLQSELPPDSELRQFLENIKTEATGRIQESMRPPGIQPGFRSEDSSNSSNDKAYQSYEQMRKNHRDKEKNLQSPSYPVESSQMELVNSNIDDSQANKKVKYNKYGDPILE